MIGESKSLLRSAVRWGLNIVALVVLGPLAAAPIVGLADAHGGHAVTLLLNGSAAGGVFACVVVILAGVVAAFVGSRLAGVQMGRTVSGLTVAWAAFSLGDVGNALRASGDGGGVGAGAVLAMVIEAAIVLVGGAVMLYVAAWADRDRAARVEAKRAGPEEAAMIGSPAGFAKAFARSGVLLGVGLGAVGALVGAWLVARDDLRGQAFMAGVLGAVLAGAAARLAGALLPGGDPKLAHRAEIPGLGVLAAGVVAPVLVFVIPGLGNVDGAVRGATFTGPSALASLDWLGGALLGTTIGINWAGSLMEREPSDSKPAKRGSGRR